MAASRYEVEVTVASARDLKNVNWRNGDLKPYAVVWIDDGAKCSTRVDLDNADNPTWDDKLTVPLPPSTRLDDAVLYLDVVHANATDGVKPLVGSARLPLRDVLADTGIGARASRSLRLKRPSGRPHGRLEVRVAVREPKRYYDPSPAYPAPYHQQSSRDPYAYGNTTTGGYGYAYGGALPAPYSAAPPAGYPSAYGGAAPTQPAYGSTAPPQPAAVSYGAPPVDAKKKSKMGMGGGLAVGAAAGVLGGLALAGGASYLENKFEDRVAERVEEDRYGGGGGGYDDYGDDDY
uniref:C2 domain-containing protein n=1 Tax=Oryza glumipatula TaxID=40148 RepID=A0A0E0B6X1_9ORYZ